MTSINRIFINIILISSISLITTTHAYAAADDIWITTRNTAVQQLLDYVVHGGIQQQLGKSMLRLVQSETGMISNRQLSYTDKGNLYGYIFHNVNAAQLSCCPWQIAEKRLGIYGVKIAAAGSVMPKQAYVYAIEQ